MTSGALIGSTSSALSFDLVSLSSVGGLKIVVNVFGGGGEILTATGRMLGDVSTYTGKARLGFTACESTVWVSGTSVVSKSPSGVSTALSFVATLHERAGSLTESLTYGGPELSRVHVSNQALTSSASSTLTMLGEGMVLEWTPRAGLGETACEASEWLSYTSLACKLTRISAGSTLPASITIAASGSLISQQVSYDVSTLTSMVRANGGGTGSAWVTVHGSGMGQAALTAMGRIGETGCEGTGWESETSVRCLEGAGDRGSRVVAVTAGVRTGSGSGMYSVDAGGVIDARGVNGARTVSAWVTVHGAGLGHDAMTAQARVGETGCEGTEWESGTSVRCITGGQGG